MPKNTEKEGVGGKEGREASLFGATMVAAAAAAPFRLFCKTKEEERKKKRSAPGLLFLHILCKKICFRPNALSAALYCKVNTAKKERCRENGEKKSFLYPSRDRAQQLMEWAVQDGSLAD